MKKTKNKTFRTTIDGYYIHDARKHAEFAFDDFLILVKYNEKNHCYDIFIRDRITENAESKQLCKEMLTKFKKFYPKSFNVIILSEMQVDLLLN
jgi:hypothetical protein